MITETFSALVAHWTNFYVALAAGAATFSGLLFVTISLHVDVIAREDKRLLRTAAKLIFNLFLTVFFIALLLLLPDQSASATAWLIAGVGVLGLTVPIVEFVQRLRSQHSGALLRRLLVPLLLPVVLTLALIRQGFMLGAGDSTGLPLLPIVLALMLATAAVLSWNLLIDLARYKARIPAQAPEPDRDRALERQLRALIREQRAQNRHLQEQTRVLATPVVRNDRAPR